MELSTQPIISTCLSHLPKDIWEARLSLFSNSLAHECVERRGCQWFISTSFVDYSNAYPSEELAFEALKEIISTESRIRALKNIKDLARASTVSVLTKRLPNMTTAPCPPPWK